MLGPTVDERARFATDRDPVLMRELEATVPTVVVVVSYTETEQLPA